jgi:hypothetical protein
MIIDYGLLSMVGTPSSDGAATGYFAHFDQALMLMPAEGRVCYAA